MAKVQTVGILLQHIVKHHSGRLSFRRVIPKDLRSFIAGEPWEYKVSIGSRDAADFHQRYDRAAKAYEQLVATAQRKRDGAFDALDAPRIAYLAELYSAECLEADDEARWDPSGRELYDAVRADLVQHGVVGFLNWRGDPRRRWAEKTRENCEGMLAHLRDLNAIGDLAGVVDMWREEAELLLEAQGLIVDPAATGAMERLCLALHRVGIQVTEAKLKRLDGEEVPTPPPPPPLQPQTQSTPTSARAKVPMLETFEGYAAAQRMTPGVKKEWWRYIQHLIDYVQHDDAALLTVDVLREWRQHLLETPTRHGKPRKPVTVRDKYITPVRAMLNWAVQEGKLPANVAADVTVRVPKEAKLRDRDFTDAEAHAILRATLLPVERRLAPGYLRAQRWIPWLCAYTGGRVNEFSQLRKEDVVQIDGIWAVRITPEAGTVKAKEARVVPLHSHLIEQGFLKMVEEQGPGPLFFDPDRQRVDTEGNRHFKKVGERLAAWVRTEVGITDPALQPNHAWRHTFKSRSYDAGIEERTADAIQGHAPQTTGRRYGKPSLKALAEAIEAMPRFAVEIETAR